MILVTHQVHFALQGDKLLVLNNVRGEMLSGGGGGEGGEMLSGGGGGEGGEEEGREGEDFGIIIKCREVFRCMEHMLNFLRETSTLHNCLASFARRKREMNFLAKVMKKLRRKRMVRWVHVLRGGREGGRLFIISRYFVGYKFHKMVGARSPCHKKSGCKNEMSASSLDSEAEARSRVESAAVSGLCVCVCMSLISLRAAQRRRGRN